MKDQVQEVIDNLPPNTWDATVWVNDNYVSGRIDPADVRRIVTQLLLGEGQYVFSGYLRFMESDIPGVIGSVFSKYSPQHAEGSDVPIYRLAKEGSIVTKADLTTSQRGDQ